MDAEGRAQIRALRGDGGEGTGAAGCEDEGGGAGVSVGVGYGGADAAAGAEDADGEVGGEVHGRGVERRCRVFVLGWSEGEGVV